MDSWQHVKRITIDPSKMSGTSETITNVSIEKNVCWNVT